MGLIRFEANKAFRHQILTGCAQTLGGSDHFPTQQMENRGWRMGLTGAPMKN